MDKIYVSGFLVKGFDDLQVLIDSEIVAIWNGLDNSRYLITDTGERFSMVSISFKEERNRGVTGLPFYEFNFYLSKFGPYGVMEISIADDGYHNLNCMTPEVERERIESAFIRLEREYGIHTSRDDIYYKSIEINKTISLDEPFTTYRRPLSLLYVSFAKTIRNE